MCLSYLLYTMLALQPADAGSSIDIDAPPAEAARIEAALQDTPASEPSGGPAARVQIVREPHQLAIVVLDPQTGQSTVRVVPVGEELTEVALAEVAQITAEILSAYSEAHAAAPQPEPAAASKDEDAAPSPETSPSDAPRFERGGFFTLSAGPGLRVNTPEVGPPSAVIAGSVGFAVPLRAKGAGQRPWTPYATFSVRVAGDFDLYDQASAMLDVWGRLRLGATHKRSFMYVSASIGPTLAWGDHPFNSSVANSAGSFKESYKRVRLGGAVGAGILWRLKRQGALGIETDIAPYAWNSPWFRANFLVTYLRYF